VFITRYYSCDELKKNEMSGSCGMCGRGDCRVLVGKPEGKRPLGRLGTEWRIMLKCIFKTWMWTGLVWLGMSTSDRPCDGSRKLFF
jgi:hypothetical protein